MPEDKEQENQDQVKGAPASKKTSILKMLVIVIVALAVAGGAGYFFYGKKLIAQYLHPSTEVKEKKAKAEIGPIVSLEPFIINVSGNPSKYVKISIAVEMKDAKAVEHLKKMVPVVRDVTLSALGAKTPEVFMDVNGRNAIKKELFNGMGSLFKNGDLRAVYITDIIMQ
ncbi:MAG: flagellar basal body-associated protein FliL [Syntrophorhabdaceae bacterium PtaU1.Bin034]|jgi:flagellar FliL protein|nr:MAG: flagellar basal body-associated protein FliL [Syntrophorhabdaceae bacterium PtaU1.Bin034]